MTDVRPRQSFVRQTASVNWSSKFHFEISQAPFEPYSDSDSASSSRTSCSALPPSFHTETVDFGPLKFEAYEHGGCRVIYTLHARCLLGDVCVHETRREIGVVPNVQPMPPLDTTDFPGEYQLNGSEPLRKHFISKWGGDLSVMTSEPQPLHLCEFKDTTSTKLKLGLRFHRTSPRSIAEPPKFSHCVVVSRLKSCTFISTMKQGSMPTLQQQNISPFLIRITRYIQSQIRKLHFPSWHEMRQENYPQGNKDGVRL